ncbi:MAG TPA: FAD-binding oxidoreductase [Xanthobacteraceae bacterium]|nr:FAD-binding oxidoreductase [Xanthobacteraceae bacterium]
MPEPFPLAPSLWAATAPPAPPTPPLETSAGADVCVIGAGYAGLSTALTLAERGVQTIVLEAREPGWGGSGRNGGQVIPGLKYDPDELEAMFGPERGPRLVDFAGRAADAVFDLIARHRMEVPHARSGWIQGAHSRASVETVKRRAGEWERRGASVSFLDKAETDRHLGTTQYLASWIDRRGGAVQPLAYARGLVRAALAAGATIHGDSPASSLERRDGKWIVTTRGGAGITADQVVMCTNAYGTELWPRLQQTVIAPNSYQIATAPLSDNVRKSILPFGQVSSDARRLLVYFRLDDQGRLLVGGRGPLREPRSDADWAHLEAMLPRLFPQAAGAPIAFRWCGRVAITRDFLPHLHAPAPGLLIDIGCMGRGIALQTAMGQAMAQYVATGNADALPLPLTPVRPLPLYGLSNAVAAAFVGWYRFLDRHGMA